MLTSDQIIKVKSIPKNKHRTALLSFFNQEDDEHLLGIDINVEIEPFY